MKAINVKFGKERLTGYSGAKTKLAAQVAATLKEVNGKASDHTYEDLHDINQLVYAAECRLENLDLPKAVRVGAKFWSVSGDPVPSAYKYSRKGTMVHFERRASGWFLVKAESTTIYKEGGKSGLILTKEQAEEAHRRFEQRSFLVAA